MIQIIYTLFGFQIVWLEDSCSELVALPQQPTRVHPASLSRSNYANGGNAKLRNLPAQTAPAWTAYGWVEYLIKATPLTLFGGRGFSRT